MHLSPTSKLGYLSFKHPDTHKNYDCLIKKLIFLCVVCNTGGDFRRAHVGHGPARAETDVEPAAEPT